MVQQMTDLERRVIRNFIHKAETCPRDIVDCLKLVTDAQIFSIDKVEAYEDELLDVCRQIILAMGAIAPTAPRSAMTPPSLAGPLHRIPHSDGDLLAAAHDSRDRALDAVILATHGDYHYANARYTNAEFSYILQKTVENIGLQYAGGSVQIRWKTADRGARTTNFIIVSEEEATRAEMNVDILFGKHYKKDTQVQQQAFASMGIESAPSSSQDQPHPSCASSVTEAACSMCAMRPTSSQEPEPCSDQRSQHTEGHRDGVQRQAAAFVIDWLSGEKFVRGAYCFVLGALVIWLWYGWGQHLH